MNWSRAALMGLSLALAPLATAQVDENCRGIPQPDDYDEQVQQDFLQNYVGLSMTLSPTHGPIPHEPGHGAIGIDLAVIPPLGCERRYVLDWTKTEETNRTPVLPKPRITFAFPALGELRPYGGFAYLPPVTIAGTTATIVSGELGAGVAFGSEDRIQLGGRLHATSAKVVADIATAFRADDDPVLDFYQTNSFGFDLQFGMDVGPLTPYASVGVTDVSTFFLVGDDNVVSNNLHPYAGPVASIGADGLVGTRFRWGAEFYAAPGGNSRPDPNASQVDFGRAGHLYTARVRLAVEL